MAIPYPSIKDFDIDIDNLEVTEGSAISLGIPVREHMRDPMWFDELGRDPIDQRKIFKLSSRDELKQKISAVLEEWPRYGPAIYTKAAQQGRRDVAEILLEQGAESDPETMRQRRNEDEDDEDEEILPKLEVEHAYFAAVLEGYLDIVKLLVEKGGVSIDYRDPDDGLIAIAFAASRRHVEIVRYLLEQGATITLNRADNGISDFKSAVKGGSIEILEMIASHEQTVAAGQKLEPFDLRFAAHSGNVDMVRCLLRSDCFRIEDPDAGLVGRGEIRLDEETFNIIRDSLNHATAKGALASVKLLLKQLTSIRPDGTFEPFLLGDVCSTQVFNATEDALEKFDTPEMFEILWDTVLHQPPQDQRPFEQSGFVSPEERLNRRLISASANGRIKTVKLLVEKYRADVNHISHKVFSTPLSRAAASSKNPLPGRLEVVEYLCGRPDLQMDLSVGEFCNGETALALAIGEANATRERQPDNANMVRLLLSLGGPVDDVSAELRRQCDQGASNDVLHVYVQCGHKDVRKPVKLSVESDPNCKKVLLKYTPREFRAVLRGLKPRRDDQALRASDTRSRPLMPPPGEELPESQRAQPTMLDAHRAADTT